MIPSLVQGDQVEVAAGGGDSGGSLSEELEKGLQQDQGTPALSPDQEGENLGGSQERRHVTGIFADESLRKTVEGQFLALNQEGVLDTGMMVLKERNGANSQLAGIAFVDHKMGRISSSYQDSAPRKIFTGEKYLYFHLPGEFVEIIEVKDFHKKKLKKRLIKIRHPIKEPIIKDPPRIILPVEPQTEEPVKKIKELMPTQPGYIYLPVQPGKTKRDDWYYILPVEPAR